MLTQLEMQAGCTKLTNRILTGIATMLFTSSVLAVAKCSAPATDCKINVSFSGIYSYETCIVSINNGSSEETVTLPTVSTSKLQKDGDETGSQSFNLSLKDCPPKRVITVHFVSAGKTADTATNNLPNETGAGFSSGVQIRIRNESGVQMLLNNINSIQEYAIPSNGAEVGHYFNAAYYAKGNGTVLPGNVTAQAGVVLTYK